MTPTSPLPPVYKPTPRDEETVLEAGPSRSRRVQSIHEFRSTNSASAAASSSSRRSLHATGDANILAREGEQVVLSWEPAPTVPPLPEIIPFGAPPGYQQSRRPTEAVKYSFSQLSCNSMILVPSMYSPDTRPLYHISVHLNCFMPFAFRTIIRRGASEDGEYVADFELGIIDTPGTFCIRGNEYYVQNHLVKKSGSHDRGFWQYNRGKTTLIWDMTNAKYGSCRTLTPPTLPKTLATFTPSTGLRRANRPVKEPQLEVLPEGQELFDEILLTLMLVERQRLSPSWRLDNTKRLWNWQPGGTVMVLPPV